jgi:hypothetical protein
MTPESHEPLGTPLSSPGFPFVPLVEEWSVLAQVHTTESLTLIVTLAGEKVSVKLGPTVTVVVAAEAVCAKAAKNDTAAAIAATITNFLLIFISSAVFLLVIVFLCVYETLHRVVLFPENFRELKKISGNLK